MSRTRRKGWSKAINSDDAPGSWKDRPVPHHAHNDWYSKKSANVKVDPTLRHADGYWGRDKAGVKAQWHRRLRRILKREIREV